ncbi:MAG: calcium/sodium antiporter [Pseudomonadota bacterium]
MGDILLVIFGLAGLILGGELLVRGAATAARAFGVSPLVIGLTLVGFGTSAPELATSVQAALADAPGIALGNVVGSNIGNILLILGLGALLAPIAVDRAALRGDMIALALATLAATALIATGGVSRGAGAVLLAGLAAYLWRTLATSPKVPGAREGTAFGPLLLALAGLAITIAAARALVLGASSLAAGLGVPEAVIGLTLVAIGTSLPELVTTLIAARKREMDLALGNIVGSNLFNILGILGVTALVAPIPDVAAIRGFDVWVMLAATAVLLVLLVTRPVLARISGALALLAYGAYLAALFSM